MTSSGEIFTYWSLLGLTPGSDSDELKLAFKREAMRWHPDRNNNNRDAEERFKWINEAYNVLSDPQKRIAWEISGRPTFELENFERPPQAPILKDEECAREPQHFSSDPALKKSPNGDNGFNSAEKLLLLIISTFSLFFLNTFVL